MATLSSNMTRSSSTDSSALSNILVGAAVEDDGVSGRMPLSTPPTSVNDNDSIDSAKSHVHALNPVEEETSRRPKRARTGLSTYNVKSLLDAQEQAGSSRSRNASGLTGRTLVDEEDDGAFLGKKDVDSTPMGWEPTELPPRPAKVQRRPSVKDRVKKAASKVVGSVLGKRGRDAMEAGKRKLGMGEVEESPKQSKILKELDMGPKGVLDELDLSDDEFAMPPPRPAKRAKIEDDDTAMKLSKPTAPPLKIYDGKRMKKWQREGLYVGQNAGMDPTKKGGRKKLQKQRPGTAGSDGTGTSEANETQVDDSKTDDTKQTDSKAESERTFMTLPMFNYLDKTRDFTIPFDIYAPTLRKGDEKPKDWTKVNKNRLVGEAKEIWEREKLPNSVCVCASPAAGEQGCEEDCLNRIMQYECTDDNCRLPAEACSNRAFSELAARMKKGGSFDVGVEVIKTSNRGFGVRSCRTYSPGQIIMEYTGEIVTEGECQRRMREEYTDKQCYYLMELERGFIIDGTKGSRARFINHSCSPNCEVRMVRVDNTPRMAVFAGENGVMTGEELTYDYNFDNFGASKQVCHCGAADCRGFLSKRLNANERKKMAKEENERKRKAAEEAQKNAESEARKKRAQTDRGANWRGWVAVDDPETKERLKAEKKEREENEKNSTRAKRLAARRQSLPAAGTAEKPAVLKKKNSSRRKTTHLEPKPTEEEAITGAEDTSLTKSTSLTNTETRTISNGSKFHEELDDRPSTALAHTSISTIVRKTEVSISTTETQEDEAPLIDLAPSAIETEQLAPLKPVNTTMTEISRPTSQGTEASAAPSKHVEAAKSGLSRTASKGKEALKSVGEAFKNSFRGGSVSSGSGAPKLKQSTLSFGKAN
ncbi:hypothetical protein LTR09_011654 [Extremus antarcticus]|uniref:SET domain-containing protein n=1 Tax=Extremus antarcticus TaxID=702011 RepID=A0AAJ0G4W0_9PEZI|nr:hypothetical protein LTR09_011654 [Extremus antarcticus]